MKGRAMGDPPSPETGTSFVFSPIGDKTAWLAVLLPCLGSLPPRGRVREGSLLPARRRFFFPLGEAREVGAYDD